MITAYLLLLCQDLINHSINNKNWSIGLISYKANKSMILQGFLKLDFG
jgi:hypothetical protein